MVLECDICGSGLGTDSIGFVRNPHPEDDSDPIVRCKDCHSSTKENTRTKDSSYMILE